MNTSIKELCLCENQKVELSSKKPKLINQLLMLMLSEDQNSEQNF